MRLALKGSPKHPISDQAESLDVVSNVGGAQWQGVSFSVSHSPSPPFEAASLLMQRLAIDGSNSTSNSSNCFALRLCSHRALQN